MKDMTNEIPATISIFVSSFIFVNVTSLELKTNKNFFCV